LEQVDPWWLFINTTNSHSSSHQSSQNNTYRYQQILPRMSTFNSQPEEETCYFQAPYDAASVLQRTFLRDTAPPDIRTEMEEVQEELDALNDRTVGQTITRQDSVLGVASTTQDEDKRRFLTGVLNELSLAEHTRQSTMFECPVRHCVKHRPDLQSRDLSIQSPDKLAPSESGTRLDDDSTTHQ
jgi:hypothetical protein